MDPNAKSPRTDGTSQIKSYNYLGPEYNLFDYFNIMDSHLFFCRDLACEKSENRFCMMQCFQLSTINLDISSLCVLIAAIMLPQMNREMGKQPCCYNPQTYNESSSDHRLRIQDLDIQFVLHPKSPSLSS